MRTQIYYDITKPTIVRISATRTRNYLVYTNANLRTQLFAYTFNYKCYTYTHYLVCNYLVCTYIYSSKYLVHIHLLLSHLFSMYT